MNNLHVLLGVVAVGAGALVLQERQIGAALSVNRDVAMKVADEQKLGAQTLGETKRVEMMMRIEETEVAGLENRIVDEAGRIEMSSLESLPPGADVEGTWPGGRPYFYVAKRHLRELTFTAVNDDVEVAANAATIFGLTRVEVDGVNAAGKRLQERVMAMELESAVATNEPPTLKGWEGEKRTFFIPARSEEEMRLLDEAFRADVASVVGRQRAEIFGDRVKETYDAGRYGFEKGRWLTMITKGKQVQFVQSDGEGNTMSSTHAVEDLEKEGAPGPYRHLFGKGRGVE